MIRPTLFYLNPVELKYYPFMISLDKYSGSCNSIDDFSTKICIPSKTKDTKYKVFNVITNNTEAKAMIKHISCNCKWNLNTTTCNSYQNGAMINVNPTVKIMVHAKKIIAEIPAHVFIRIANI